MSIYHLLKGIEEHPEPIYQETLNQIIQTYKIGPEHVMPFTKIGQDMMKLVSIIHQLESLISEIKGE